MSQRPKLVTGEYYHLFNRGVAKQAIYQDEQDYRRFMLTLAFYLESRPGYRFSFAPQADRDCLLATTPREPLVEVLAYCLMPNHFHLLVRQRRDDGITTFVRRSLNSYSRAYNTRFKRVGPLFQGRFRAVRVESDAQLLHLTRYIHLNPSVSGLVQHPNSYPWSSYLHYLGSLTTRLCQPKLIIEMIGSTKRYESFVEDYADYGRELALIKELLLEES